jgi:DNA-binding transcriptional ArsR family regulator
MTQASSQPPRIFICYRHDDSAGHAGRLCDHLGAHFGDEQIFMDNDYIKPGEDFVRVIEKVIGSCEVLLAVIGQGWLTSRDETRRLDNPNDYVRLEITAALTHGVDVIPTRVQGAQRPRPQDVPEDLLPLLRIQDIELSDRRWKRDVDQLIDVLEKVLGRRREEGQPQAHRVSHTQRTERLQTSDSYEPDATAIQILEKIEKQICWEYEIATDLKIELTQVSNYLRLLEKHGYIHVTRPEDTAPYCELSQKGYDYLNKPHYKVPHPAGEGPNETEVKILTLLADPNCTPFLDSLSINLQLDPTRLTYHLTELIKRDYVRANSFDDWGVARYELTHKARGFLIDNNLI